MDTLTVRRWIDGQHKPVPLVEAMRDLPPDLLYLGFDTGEVERGHPAHGLPMAHAPGDSASQVAHCMHFITEECEPDARSSISSNVLKHMVEKWMRARKQTTYISNGSAIAAAILCGFALSRSLGPKGPNASVNGIRVKVVAAPKRAKRA
jgi:hypothetical protein